MKRSVNFNGMKKWRGATANDLLATMRFLGMSDKEIKEKLLEMKFAQQSVHPTPESGGEIPADVDQSKDNKPAVSR